MADEQKQDSPWIINTTPETFDQDVFEKSHETLVIVDFWAAWCAPCRQLAPVLEGLANELEGKFILVKANTEEVPEAAGKFQVSGIPAVYAVIDGEVVDAFQGALPEEQIRGWLDSLSAVSLLAEAKRLEELSPEGAEAKYRILAEQSPNDAVPQIGLARTLLAQERFDDCQEVIDQLEKRGFLEPEAEKVKSALGLRGNDGGDVAELREKAAADPDNLELQLQVAEALAGAQEYEEALQACLAIVERDKKGVGDTARQVMIDIFRVLPDDSELTTTYRRKLSMALY
jgi:putative thioredoxin